jgi:hypothetical protein
MMTTDLRSCQSDEVEAHISVLHAESVSMHVPTRFCLIQILISMTNRSSNIVFKFSRWQHTWARARNHSIFRFPDHHFRYLSNTCSLRLFAFTSTSYFHPTKLRRMVLPVQPSFSIPLSSAQLEEINDNLSNLEPQDILAWGLHNLPGLFQSTGTYAVLYFASTIERRSR